MQRRGNIFFYNKEFKFNQDFIAAKLLYIREHNHNLTRFVELKDYKYIIRGGPSRNVWGYRLNFSV